MTLEGRTAVVTGAASGIGFAFCQRLAELDANVVGVDLHDATERLERLPGVGQRTALKCDISNPEEVQNACSVVLERFDRCDVLVNNAGIYPIMPFDELTGWILV